MTPMHSALSLLVLSVLGRQLPNESTQGKSPEAHPITRIDFKGKPFPRGLRFSSDGSQIWNDQLEAWSVPDGKVHAGSPVKQRKGRYVIDFASKQERSLIVERRSGKTLLGTLDGRHQERRLRQTGSVMAARFLKDEKRFSVLFSDPPSLYVGSIDTDESDKVVPLPFKTDRGVIGSSGNLVVTRSGSDVRIWDVRQRKLRAQLAHKSKVFSVAISPSERFVATGAADNQVRLFDTAEGELVVQLSGHEEGTIFLTSAVYSLAFSPNGKQLASGGHDGRVIVWDVSTHRETFRAQIAGPPIIVSVTFSSDSRLVAASFENSGAKRGIRVWQLPTDDDNR